MDTTVNAQAVIAKNQPLENLLANPDFVTWKSSTIEKHLQDLQDKVLQVNREADGWQNRLVESLIAYQEAKYTYETIFEQALVASRQARSSLQSPMA